MRGQPPGIPPHRRRTARRSRARPRKRRRAAPATAAVGDAPHPARPLAPPTRQRRPAGGRRATLGPRSRRARPPTARPAEVRGDGPSARGRTHPPAAAPARSDGHQPTTSAAGRPPEREPPPRSPTPRRDHRRYPPTSKPAGRTVTRGEAQARAPRAFDRPTTSRAAPSSPARLAPVLVTPQHAAHCGPDANRRPSRATANRPTWASKRRVVPEQLRGLPAGPHRGTVGLVRVKHVVHLCAPRAGCRLVFLGPSRPSSSGTAAASAARKPATEGPVPCRVWCPRRHRFAASTARRALEPGRLSSHASGTARRAWTLSGFGGRVAWRFEDVPGTLDHLQEAP